MPASYYPPGWTPARLRPIGWWRASRDTLLLNGTALVGWRSSYTDGLVLSPSGTPTVSVNGRGLGIPTVDFDSASADVLIPAPGTEASYTAQVAGTNAPFSLFVTFKCGLTSEQNIICWNSAADANYSALRVHNDGNSGVIRYSRLGDTSSVDADCLDGQGGSIGLGTARWWRACVLYDGANIIMCVDRRQGATVTGGGVGPMNPTTFRVGMGAVLDGLTGQIADFVPIGRRVEVADYIAYYNWSVKTYGYT